MSTQELHEVMPYLLLGSLGISSLWFLVFFCAGMYNFYRARRLLIFIVSQDIFDNNSFAKGFLYEKSRINFTQEVFYGQISEYSAIAIAYQSIDKFINPTVEVDVYLRKFNGIRIEAISFPLSEIKHKDIKKETADFISHLKEKGNSSADIDDGLRYSRVTYCGR